MIRHLLTATTIGFFSCTAQGFSGFYGGADLGVSIFKGDHTYTDAFGKDKEDFTKIGALLGAHLGYMKEIGASRIVLGLEGYLNTSTARAKDDLKSSPAKTKVGTFEAKRKMSAGLSLIGGKLVNPKVMIYGKLSFERGSFEIDYKNNLMSPTSKTRKKTMFALVPGAGIHYKAAERVFSKNDKILVGFEYNYAGFYKDIDTRLNSSTIRYDFEHVEHRIFAKISYMI